MKGKPLQCVSGDLCNRLIKEIDLLACRPILKDAPKFKPHVTLLGGIELSKSRVLSLTSQLASSLKPFPIVLDRVSSGSIFHQCVYVLCNETAQLMQAGAEARRAFEMHSIYMPHLSLLYSDVDPATRLELMEEEQHRLFGDGSEKLEETAFMVDAIQVWYTPGEDKSLESWHCVAQYPL